MPYNIGKISRCIAYASFGLIVSSSVAFADVFGRLNVIVREQGSGDVVPGAEIDFHDLTKERPDSFGTTDAGGKLTSPPLQNTAWGVFVRKEGFRVVGKQVKVSADSTTDVELMVERIPTEIEVRGANSMLNPNETSSVTSRDQQFLQSFPVTNRDPEQLTGLLESNPGFVEDSANQVHPRGEHSATAIYIQGFELGGAAQGRFGPLIDPQTFENLDAMTGAFAPEYAGDSAILNTTIRSGTIEPGGHMEVGGGNYQTGNGAISYGGQFGSEVGAPDKDGNRAHIFSYFLSGSGHTTDNALEPPQPGDQTAHNRGNAGSFLGKFDFTPEADDTFSLILNTSPAKTQVANRAGLPDSYAPYGQGYGFGGALSATQAAQQGIVSQEAAGQDIFQEDRNSFGVVQWRHEYNTQISSLLSVGIDQSILNTMNENPAVDLNALPDDNSIEYNPTVKQDAKHKQIAGSVTEALDSHTIKVGAQYIDESDDSSYQLTPASQLATNALFASDSRLVPAGTPAVDANGDPILDANGNQVYNISPGATSPTLNVHERGFSEAAYIQDTWRVFKPFTANYGLRLDEYHAHQNLDQAGISKGQVSPRVNLSYNFYPTWIARSSYNRLFIEPPLSQGSIIGESIKPEKVNQYEASIEKQFTSRQAAKIGYYYKDIKDQVDTGLLIPSTQLGLFTSVNFDRDAVHGTEISYQLLPDEGFGTSSYVAYSWSKAMPGGLDNTGAPAPRYNDHDQRNTLSSGLAYTFNNKTSVGSDIYYGSGVESSRLTEDAPRKQRERTDVSVTSPPDLLFGRAGLKLTVSNIFDDRSRINYNSGFSGTRFEQGTSFLLTTFLNF